MIEQRSAEWYEARLGKATASRFADVMAIGANGKPLAGWKNYKAELVTERLTKQVSGNYQSAAMLWGIENEPLARLLYMLKTGCEVAETGFWEHKKLAAGASPDGLVGDDGIIEVKCPNTATHIETLGSRKIPSQYIAQVQGQLWITDRKWADFVSFDPRMPDNARIIIIPVKRDDAYIERLEGTLIQFLNEVDETVNFVKNYSLEEKK